jgi:CHAT domain-containing protein
LTDKNDQNSQVLADIFNNRGNLFNIKKSYDVSIEYLEKSIRIYTMLGTGNTNIIRNLSVAYGNISIAYIETKKYLIALSYLQKSVDLTNKYGISGISFNYLNIAKTYVKLGEQKKAEEYYLKSIASFKKEFGDGYYRMAEVYFDYGLFMRSEGKNTEALIAHKKALVISLKNYGEKHTLVSLAYKHIADDYFHQDKLDSALYYYQKSLIAVVKNFNNPDIFSNPSIDSSLFDIRLLDNLKSKAQALDLLAARQKEEKSKLIITGKSFETIELAIQLIDRIRNNYMSEESRIYLAENEKETYLFAAHLAYNMLLVTHDELMGIKMYSIAQKAKAAILRNEITGNELLNSAGIPDSLREKQNRLTGEIAAYNNLIIEENRKTKPDSSKISLWKDALFDMNRNKEKVAGSIEKAFPQYHDLLRKTEPLSLSQIQSHLKKDETIIDYLVSNQYSEGKRKLFAFVITGKSLDISEQWLDSLFVKNAEIIRRTANPSNSDGAENDDFKSYTSALNYMYQNLVKPLEGKLAAKKLIIIPDEEIGWLPFDAFLRNKPEPDKTDYEGLHYLINDYTFSYAYSSSLLFNKDSRSLLGAEVLAFSPDYRNSASSGSGLTSLKGAGEEIGSIYKWFRGKDYSGEKATKANFLSSLQKPAIFHLAMHSMTDSINPKYSYLMFDTHSNSAAEGRLYNYEISLTRINSPMVVLSSCNSGSGTLYSGEGLMSISRSFRLAGASSVVITAWEINDETSAAIIKRFYWYLSKGDAKNEAMRLAKQDYLKDSPPAFTNPYFWAAYEVLGDNSPISRSSGELTIILCIVILIAAGGVVAYFRWRKIFSARS